MIRTALVACLLAAGPALAEETRTVVLAERLVADGPVITLGDLFEDAGDAADIMLARAPAPGQRLSLTPSFVREAAAREGLVWANAGGLMRVTVERAARQVTAQDIAGLLQEALFVETGQVHAVRLSNQRQVLFAPMDALGGPELIQLDHDAGSHLFRAEIAAWPGGEIVQISGRAETVADIPVLARAVSVGEVISASDLTWIQLPTSQVNAQILTDAGALIGQAARRPLRADTPLRAFDVKAPTVIRRGDIVSLVFQSGPLTLAARARALDDAADGQVIRFVNLQSNRTVEAVADGPGRARVTRSAYTH